MNLARWADASAKSPNTPKLLLTDAGVLVIPGNGYGQYGEGYVRISLTVSGDRDGELVAEAVRRIKENIKADWS